ncbi:MAG: methyltransferase domain-containing protein [Bradymonadales bacterium]|nr:methyltransferase domain-containing protein [Bradymonadales bacterium]
MDEVRNLLVKPEFPRSNGYDLTWVLDNQMGPNALWLAEWLCSRLPLAPGMRILDLGCGKAISSIFLAREYQARVWAVDLWMDPDPNWRRVLDTGCADLVCPLRAEAHALPFAEGFFDGAICLDAYQYFGTDELYLDYLSRFVRPGGFIGVVAVGLMQPIGKQPPAHLVEPQSNGKVFWEDSCRCFKTVEFWQDLWDRCGKVTEVQVEPMPDGWRHWRDFDRALELTGKNKPFPSDVEALERDGGRYVGFVRLTARRTEMTDFNLYDPSLGFKVGVDS